MSLPSRIAAATLLLALTGACTGGGTTSEGPDAVATAATGTPSGEPEPSSTPVFAEDADVLDVAIPEPSTLDPMRIQDPGSVLVARQLFESLTRWDPIQERVVPAAAESWAISDRGQRFTFRLRQGMTFHDGSPVTAEDFAFAFDRIAQKANGSDLAYTLELIQGFDIVNGLGTADHLSGLRTPNELTLIITLTESFMDFPGVLTHPGLVPLREEAVTDINSFLQVPVGNGPFMMAKAWAVGQPVLLRPFPGFIQTPEVDGIRLLPYPDAAGSWLQFVRGDLDVAEVPAGQIAAAEKDFGDQGFKPFLAGYYFGLNVRSSGLKRLEVRKAINRGVDRQTIAKTIYKGTLEPPRGIVPVGMPGFQENVCTQLCDFAPEIGRNLMKKVPARDRDITLEYTQGEPHGEVAHAVAANLEDIGFKVRVKAYPFPRYLKRLRDGRQTMYRLGWIAEYPVADAFLTALFKSRSPDNHTRYSSAKVDSLLAEARREPSENRRVQLYVEAEKEILKSAPVVPIGSFVTHWAAQPNIEGIQFDVMGGFDAVNISIAGGE